MTKRYKQGFTLLEILIVIMLMGVMISMVSLTLPEDFSTSGKARTLSDKMKLIMEEIRDRASMEGRLIGLRIDERGYKFLYRVKNNYAQSQEFEDLTQELMLSEWDRMRWELYPNETLKVSDEIDDELRFSLEIGGLKIESDSDVQSFEDFDFEADRHSNRKEYPQILFFPTGDITPFKLYVNYMGDYIEEYICIEGKEIGKIDIVSSEER